MLSSSQVNMATTSSSRVAGRLRRVSKYATALSCSVLMLLALGLRRGTTIHGYTLSSSTIVGSRGGPRVVSMSMQWTPTMSHHDRAKFATVLMEHIEDSAIPASNLRRSTTPGPIWLIRVTDCVTRYHYERNF